MRLSIKTFCVIAFVMVMGVGMSFSGPELAHPQRLGAPIGNDQSHLRTGRAIASSEVFPGVFLEESSAITRPKIRRLIDSQHQIVCYASGVANPAWSCTRFSSGEQKKPN